MTAKSCSQGYDIEFDIGKSIWIYSDTKEGISHTKECRKCGYKPTLEGYDSCVGFLKGVISACCGHGVENPYAVTIEGIHLKFNNVDEMEKYFR